MRGAKLLRVTDRKCWVTCGHLVQEGRRFKPAEGETFAIKSVMKNCDRFGRVACYLYSLT